HQFFMISSLNDSSSFHKANFITMTDCIQSMCNCDASSSVRRRINRYSNNLFTVCVQCTRCFIENDNFWISDQSSRNCNSLFL
ncbi:hypothetical protein PFISCL1PPCAC_15249, partial [Pristionchus fissidentatus]